MTCLPNLGEKAPNFQANTTFGSIELSDYAGKWVVLFSHPGDFTPVCTTEFIAFTNLAPIIITKLYNNGNVYKIYCRKKSYFITLYKLIVRNIILQ